MTKRFSILDIMAHKHAQPLVMLTAYTAPIARLLDTHVDILLVGDSLGMVVYGMDSTLGVTLEMMIRHGQAVVRASMQAMVVVDLPFGSYQASPEAAYIAAAQVMAESGCTAVKLEGGTAMAPTIRFLSERGIPVMAHIGLLPQHVHALGGYRFQGKDEAATQLLLQDALNVEAAGAFAVVFEGIQEEAARRITHQLHIPSIGIGASNACDGQVLVIDDLLGLTPHPPRFAKAYAQLAEPIVAAAKAYAADVRSRAFPDAAHCFPFGKSKSD